MASVEGSLTKIGVPELFRAIARESRTGSLTLTRSGAEARVFFRDGEAYHARSIGSGVQLGARLISAGVITNDDLHDALALQKAEGGGRRLGQILQDKQLVTSQDLQAIVAQQIEDTIFEILRWDGGEFRFDQDVLTDEDIGLHVSVENLVMEGARRFREWHQITRRVPTLDAVPIFNEESAEIDVALTPEEWAFVSRVDGLATIKELAYGCGFTDLEAGRTVFGLVTAGLLDVELPTGVELPTDDTDLDEVFDELERALQEAAAPRDGAQSQPTLEELVIGDVSQADALGSIDAAQASLPEAIADLPGLEELPEIDEVRRDPSLEEAAVSMEPTDLPQLAAEELILPDTWAEPQAQEFVPTGQEWAAPEIVMPDPEEVVPIGHNWTDVATEPDEVAEVDQPIVEEVAEVDQPIVEEGEMATANGVHPDQASSAGSDSWGDLRIKSSEDQAEAEPAASWLAPEVQASEPVFEAAEVSASVIVEEAVDLERSRPAAAHPSVARLFAELSFSGSDQPSSATQPEPVQPVSEQKETPEVDQTERPTPRLVDPSVDTTALLREFSGLGLNDEQVSPDWGQVEPRRRAAAQSDAEKGRGLFGKKRK